MNLKIIDITIPEDKEWEFSIELKELLQKYSNMAEAKDEKRH